jgi:predicted protein tyrosine phosphatase
MLTDIYVCSLSRLTETVEATGARYVVSAINPWSIPATPGNVEDANHLRLAINDIEQPHRDLVHPEQHHIETLVDFAGHWDRKGPLVVHCLAGISRSSASAFIVACALNQKGNEGVIAQSLRDASPTAAPNRLMIRLADAILGRDGRMTAAIERLSPSVATLEANTFSIPSCY